MNKLLSTFLLLTVLALPAHAWNALGHKTVAELAWRQLPSQTRQALADILRHHPHFEQLLLDQILSFAHADSLNSGQTPRDSIPSMTLAYARQACTIALRRLFLASKRLADELVEVGQTVPITAT